MQTPQAGMPTIEEVLAAMTPEQKLATAFRLREAAWELVAAGVRMREPALPESDVQERVRSIFARVDAVGQWAAESGIEKEWCAARAAEMAPG